MAKTLTFWLTEVLRTTVPIMAQTFKNPQKSNLDLWTSSEPQLRAVKAGGMNSSQNTHWNHIRYGSDSEESIRCAKFPCFLEILVVEVPRDYSAWFYSAPRIKRCYNPSGSGLQTFQRRQMAKKNLFQCNQEHHLPFTITWRDNMKTSTHHRQQHLFGALTASTPSLQKTGVKQAIKSKRVGCAALKNPSQELPVSHRNCSSFTPE